MSSGGAHFSVRSTPAYLQAVTEAFNVIVGSNIRQYILKGTNMTGNHNQILKKTAANAEAIKLRPTTEKLKSCNFSMISGNLYDAMQTDHSVEQAILRLEAHQCGTSLFREIFRPTLLS